MRTRGTRPISTNVGDEFYTRKSVFWINQRSNTFELPSPTLPRCAQRTAGKRRRPPIAVWEQEGGMDGASGCGFVYELCLWLGNQPGLATNRVRFEYDELSVRGYDFV